MDIGGSSTGGLSLQSHNSWFAKLRSIKVDIVGDYAGSELFIIHGESLIRHCVKLSRVDFTDGFQLLHAVYAVETFLNNFYKRGCNFDIAFFRSLRHVCAPDIANAEDRCKYELFRTILIQHLQRSPPADRRDGVVPKVLDLASPSCSEFVDYLDRNPVRFMVCHEGDYDVSATTSRLQALTCYMVEKKYDVAFMGDVEFQSSKIFAFLVRESSARAGSSDINVGLLSEPSNDETLVEDCPSTQHPPGVTLSQHLTIILCEKMLQSPADFGIPEDHIKDIALALLLQASIIRALPIHQRQQWTRQDTNPAIRRGFDTLNQICRVFHRLVLANLSGVISGCKDERWDLYDLMDGRVYLAVLKGLLAESHLPGATIQAAVDMSNYMGKDAKDTFIQLLKRLTPSQSLQASSISTRVVDSRVLPFGHPVMDSFLRDMKLSVSDEVLRDTETAVFHDLHHWHRRRLLQEPTPHTRLDERTQRAHQRLMADVTSYSASLVGANGKVLNPEVIVVEPSKHRKSAKPKPVHAGQKKVGRDPSGTKKGGIAAAREAAREIQARKMRGKQDGVVVFWEQECQQLEKSASHIDQYLKALKFLENRTPEETLALRGEVHLYLCRALLRILASSHDTASRHSGQYLVALIFRWLREMSLQGCTKTVSKCATDLLRKLELPGLSLQETSSPDRELPFKFESNVAGLARAQGVGHQQLQLQSGGAYMDRRFDPRTDDRVPFQPDAWQRKVLDSIDDGNSILAVAPTSAGKTFISFYAMKQVLRESDDGVLVYVSPTKALVNQTAAEIGARFSKSYDSSGKSVWAIHTRDYRINNPTGCQVLITVPHILQIMLLSASNSTGPRPWSKRIKRIIFDEVHCIGQAEDGVVWEQLLLMAPCPIIALSATVGNPDEFKRWLAASQSKKGYKLDMIVHGVRYSDLRKFIYQPQSAGKFRGLERLQVVPVPGLDEGMSVGNEFKPIHPINALSHRDIGALKDVSLEPRDCLALWQAMQSVLSRNQMKEFDFLSPAKSLPDIIAKSDVVHWEAKLKGALTKILMTAAGSFHRIQRKLLPEPAVSHTAAAQTENPLDGIFSLVCDLHRKDALPALVFNYDRNKCVAAVETIFQELEDAEAKWKKNDAAWRRKITKYEEWKQGQDRASKKPDSACANQRGEERALVSKLERDRDEGSIETSPWERFDPNAPLEQFSFAGTSKMSPSELEELTKRLKYWGIPEKLLAALRRGIGVHHAGMNRRYRQIVERLFRRGYLRVVVATGTLALGINMPCPTVVFCGDSIFLTAQNYRQASGRAGRRGFDLLGNVVFHGIAEKRVHEIMSSRLPDLKGQFPITTSLVLRLFGLLHGTHNDAFAAEMVQSLLTQTRLYLGGEEAELAIKHHVRFSIDYLRRQHLLSSDGTPVNFAGMIRHLYYTEASAFAFHALLKGGYFHRLCGRTSTQPSRVKLELMLVLSHIFGVLPITHNLKSGRSKETILKSSSIVFLPQMPDAARDILMQHNKDTLSVLTNYVSSYVVAGNLDKYPEQALPYSGIKMRHHCQNTDAWATKAHYDAAIIRSPFVALSGYDDTFDTIRELCLSMRNDAFLEESAVPYIPVWPDNTCAQPNAYLYDFFKHGSMKVLVRDNWIKAGDVWQLLDNFSKILATIVTSLEVNIETQKRGEDDGDYEDDLAEDLQGIQLQPQEYGSDVGLFAELDLDDQAEDSDSGLFESNSSSLGDLSDVLQAFKLLQEDFNAKFRKNFA